MFIKRCLFLELVKHQLHSISTFSYHSMAWDIS